ncbi:L-serine ammonia-lyase [Pigmentiphaga sp. H8]|uniref:L-serine ammonia-lyase n=1 Tax=unclassified Pigmentiphaga TaxID=2626614 RepID=UPI000F5B4955|nr:L-serine ammonia-lyase [Pigmentiphaga sp. H8]AZG06615.1 L-serine ammonia-lyase [Pigmentiphaga sp. H8]
MFLSVFDLYKIGIGPSSSHTVGPMKAAAAFARGLAGIAGDVAGVTVDLHGSLALTGRGHGTDRAVLLGLEGNEPESVDTAAIAGTLARIRETGRLRLAGVRDIPFHEVDHLRFHRRALPYHPNGMRFAAHAASGATLAERTCYSVGGGFVVDEGGAVETDRAAPAHPFRCGAELLAMCESSGLSVAGLVARNEEAWRSADELRRGLMNLWEVMKNCVERGCRAQGDLPGPLGLARRAPALRRQLESEPLASDGVAALDWLGLYALAVCEENAAGGRMVTAPTNGAAGILPALLHYYVRFVPGANEDGVAAFLLTAAGIGMLYKLNASLSGAEVGCQGEVGVACSMGAAGLAAVMGGTPRQVEYAAEIGMEHNLGLTCDPIGGLVQVPCIERNAMGAVKALNAARMALRTDGRHRVSLDEVIKTMMDTGADMKDKYKETARGGLAINVVAC